MKKHLTWFDRLMMAVTFAEADEAEVARQFTCKPEHRCPATDRTEEGKDGQTPHLHGAKA